MLPMLTLLDLFNKLRPDEFRPTGDLAFHLGAKVESFHQVVGSARHGIIKCTAVRRRPNEGPKLFSRHDAAMDDGHGADTGSFQNGQSRRQVKESAFLFVVNIKLEEVVRQATIVDGVLRIQPFAKKDVAIFQHDLQEGACPSSIA